MDEQKTKAPQKVTVSKENHIALDYLITIIRQGGKIRPGTPVINNKGETILDASTIIDSEETLTALQKSGLFTLQIDFAHNGRLWDRFGKLITYPTHGSTNKNPQGVEVHDLFGNTLFFKKQ